MRERAFGRVGERHSREAERESERESEAERERERERASEREMSERGSERKRERKRERERMVGIYRLGCKASGREFQAWASPDAKSDSGTCAFAPHGSSTATFDAEVAAETFAAEMEKVKPWSSGGGGAGEAG